MKVKGNKNNYARMKVDLICYYLKYLDVRYQLNSPNLVSRMSVLAAEQRLHCASIQ